MDDRTHPPALADLLDALPPDPPPVWPTVPPAPAHPGSGWEQRRTEGTNQLVWTKPLSAFPTLSDPATLWLQHRSRFERTELWPVLVDDEFWESVELEPFDTPAFADARELLRRRAQGDDADDVGLARGEMPAPVTDHRNDLQVIGPSTSPTSLLLVPARAGWVVPGLIGWTAP